MSVANNPKIFYWLTLIGGINFLAPVITLFYLHRGLEYADLFILLTLIVVAMLLFEVPTGIFADHFGYRASFLAGQLLFTISGIILFFAHTPALFYISQFLIGIGITFYSGSQESFIHDSLKEVNKLKDQSSWNGKMSAAFMITSIFAAIMGAILSKDLLEWQFQLLLVATIFFGLIRFGLTFLLTNPKKHTEQQSPFHHIGQGWRTIRHSPFLLLLFLNEILVMIPLHVFDHVVKQPFLLEAGLPVFLFGVVFATRAALSALMSHNLDWFERYFSVKSIIITTNVVIFFAYIGGAYFQHTVATAVLLLLVLALANALRLPFFVTLKNDLIPDGSRATTLSLLSVIDSAFDVVIFISLAFIADFGLPMIFLGSAVVVFIGCLFPIKHKSSNDSSTP